MVRNLSREPSEESLDVYIPSFPGSPRSLSLMDVSDFTFTAITQSPIQEVAEEGAEQDDLLEHYETDLVLEEDTNILAATAIENNQVIQKLINTGADIQQTDHIGRNALHFAVQNGDMEAIEMLLIAGTNPSVKDDVGMTPLMLCLMRNPSVKIVNLLFEHGALILPRSSPMDTGIFLQFVMMCTPTKEEAEILKILVEKGAIVNDPLAPGKRQALHFAAMSNNCDLINILIDLGADLFARNHRNETPRDVAHIFNCKQAATLLGLLENKFNSDIEEARAHSDRFHEYLKSKMDQASRLKQSKD